MFNNIPDELSKKIDEIILESQQDKYGWELNLIDSEYKIKGLEVYYDTYESKYITKTNIATGMLIRYIKSIKNIITAQEYKWTIKDTGNKDNLSKVDKMVAQSILDFTYDKLKVDNLSQIIVEDLLKYYFSIAQVTWNEKTNDISLKSFNPFYTILEPGVCLNAGKFNGEYIILLEKITKQKLLNMGITEEQMNTNSSGDHLITQYDKMNDTLRKTHSYLSTHTLYITHYYRKENGKVKYNKLFGNVNLNEEIMDDYPLILFKAQEENYEIYGTPVLSLMTPLAEKLQYIYGSFEKYMSQYVNRVLIKQGNGRLKIHPTSKQYKDLLKIDQILEIEGEGASVTELKPGAMPSEIKMIMDILGMSLQDTTGIHSASMGEVVGRSGIQDAQAQKSDKMNQYDIVQIFKGSMEELGKLILNVYSKYLKEDLKINFKGLNLRLIGKQEYDTLEKLGIDMTGLYYIKPLERLKLEMVPADLFSETYIYNKLIEARSLGLNIPDEVIMESLKTGSLEEILTKNEIKQELEANKDLDMEKASIENKQIMKGVEIQPSKTDDPQKHLMIHMKGLEDYKNIVFKEMDSKGLSKEEIINALDKDPVIKIYNAHIAEHNKALQTSEAMQKQQNVLSSL